MRVLVVEDEVFLALELEQALSGEGAEVVGPSHTGRSGYALAREEVLTAAVVDVQVSRVTASLVAQELSDRGIPSSSIIRPKRH